MSNYDFKNHKKGDTFEGVAFTVTKNGSALDLTGASIRMQLREKSETGTLGATYTDGDGITITDPTNGVFTFDKQIIDIRAQKYYYDIEITLASGDVKSYIYGTWTITQDVTQPA